MGSLLAGREDCAEAECGVSGAGEIWCNWNRSNRLVAGGFIPLESVGYLVAIPEGALWLSVESMSVVRLQIELQKP